MVDINWLGGLVNFSIPEYVIIGVVLMIFGLLVASFLPINVRKYGIIMFFVGLVMAVGFRLIENWWQNDVFKAVVVGIAVFGMIMLILFPSETKGIKLKK